jgi:hypothetical protein
MGLGRSRWFKRKILIATLQKKAEADMVQMMIIQMRIQDYEFTEDSDRKASEDEFRRGNAGEESDEEYHDQLRKSLEFFNQHFKRLK